MNLLKKRTAIVSSFFALAVFGLLMDPGPLSAQEPESYHVTEDDFAEERVYSPYAGRDYPDQVLFGDTHFHTNLSFDAGLVGTSLTMDEGYRFARGEKVISKHRPAGAADPCARFSRDHGPCGVHWAGTYDSNVGSGALGGSMGEVGARTLQRRP